jgi:hypothetical protein
MDKFYVVEVNITGMYPMGEPIQFLFCKTNDDKSIQELLNDHFRTLNREYDYFLHEVSLEAIQENHLTLLPRFYGHNFLCDPQDVRPVDDE